jgi:hypothetical protein
MSALIEAQDDLPARTIAVPVGHIDGFGTWRIGGDIANAAILV